MAERDTATKIVRPLRGGQITIPASFRKSLGIDEDTLLRLTLIDGELRVKPVRPVEMTAGSSWLTELYELFAPFRERAAQYTEEEINETIDQAVRAVRRGDD